MKYLLLLLWLTCMQAFGQEREGARLPKSFLTSNPLAMAEPNMAVGGGYGKRLTKRSSYFSELSYLFSSPFYKVLSEGVSGFRFIGQYRYDFNRSSRNFFGIGRRHDGGSEKQSFLAFELRAKPYQFSGSGNFINHLQGDTLFNFPYKGRAVVFGGAILLGDIFDLSPDGKWQLEVSAGLGIKQKRVKLKKLPKAYNMAILGEQEWGVIPRIYEEAVTLNLLFAVRLRYHLR